MKVNVNNVGRGGYGEEKSVLVLVEVEVEVEVEEDTEVKSRWASGLVLSKFVCSVVDVSSIYTALQFVLVF